MNMSVRTLPVLTLAALCASASPAFAQWTFGSVATGSGTLGTLPVTELTREGTKSVDIGNRYLGGSLTVNGRFWANRYSTGVDTGGSISAFAVGKLLKESRTLADFHMGLGSSAFRTAQGNAFARLRLAGYSYPTWSYTTPEGNLRYAPGARQADLFDPDPSFTVSFLVGDVTISGNLGVYADVAIDTTIVRGGSVQLRGSTTIAGQAVGTGVLRVIGIKVGSLEAKGDFLRNGLSVNVNADARRSSGSSVRVTGVIGYTLAAIALKLKVCAHYGLGSSCSTLIDWTLGRLNVPNVLALGA
ncbi:MAG: hypothetical protein AAF628_30410 [Planctomycetota bacterium]